MKAAKTYSFEKGEFQQTRDAVNAILWALKLHGPFTDGPRATTRMYHWIEEHGFEFNSKYTFNAALARLEEEGVLDRGIKGKTTHNIRFIETADPPFSNPLKTDAEEAPPKPISNGSIPEQPPADKHTELFHNTDLVGKRKHLSHEHDTHDYETRGSTGPELEIVHRNCHDIEAVLAKKDARETVVPAPEPPPQVPDVLPPPDVDMDPATIQGKILNAITLLSSAMLDSAGVPPSEGAVVEALREEIKRQEGKAKQYENKYVQMKGERDRLWHINKRQEANLDALINGKPIDDKEYRAIRREMAAPPGKEKSSGTIDLRRNGRVAHTSTSEGYDG